MKELEKKPTAENKKVSPADNQKGIKNHKKAASHLEKAAKHHLEAADHHEDGNHEEAAKSTVVAQGHVALAKEAQKEDAKQHAMKS